MLNHPNAVVGSLAALIVISTLCLMRKNRKVNEATWDELLALLKPIKMEHIALVAVEYLNPGHSALRTEPILRFNLLGGSNGLRLMVWNANVMLALASHAERWDKGESKYVASLMRRDGLILRRAVWQIRMRSLIPTNYAAKSAHVQVVASKYYQMSERLLDLYRHIPYSGFSSLDIAVWGS